MLLDGLKAAAHQFLGFVQTFLNVLAGLVDLFVVFALLIVFLQLLDFVFGFADAFFIRDSTYVFTDNPPLIMSTPVPSESKLLCFCSVNFPSRDAMPTSTKGGEEEEPSYWQFKVYLTKPDGTITETVLDINEPLKAGDLKIIKGELDDEGAVRPYDSTVGVSVTLDWNSAGQYDTPL